MISFDQAKQIALQKIGPECGLIEDSTIEKPYGWYFMYQSKEFLRTGDHRHMLLGSGGFIVEKENARIFKFGSAFSLEENFSAYEYGLKYDRYDLTITSIRDLERTLDFLLRLKLHFVIPEFAHGRQWRVPQPYRLNQLREKLAALPTTFQDCRGFHFCYEVFLEIDKAGCFGYELREHQPPKDAASSPSPMG
ncbi:MAG TPA: YrhB domain-containing protein [Tepidisphaeraceae bacterium]|jgi:hypothetical protein|nr:YrhB domain-containing protein [Tepidisphaeraceae bacterium]